MTGGRISTPVIFLLVVFGFYTCFAAPILAFALVARSKDEKKILWIVGIFFLGPLVACPYLYLNAKSEKTKNFHALMFVLSVFAAVLLYQKSGKIEGYLKSKSEEMQQQMLNGAEPGDL